MANANSTIEIELEIKQALDQLNKLQDELKNSSKGFSQAGKSAQRFERVIKSAMSGVATAMKKSLSIITSFRTALVGLVGVYSASEFVQFGANFEREISKLNALTRATETEQLRLRKAIREVGSSTAFTATQAAAAANVLAALGRTSNQISQELGVVVRVAGATSTAIETVSEAIAAQINVFGESAEQVGNVFAAAYSTSAANVEKLQIALGQVGPIAKSAGLTLTETAGAIAFLIDRGFRAEAAGTALRGTLIRLINPSKAVLEEFQSLGVSFEEIQKLGFQDQMQVLADRLGSVASQAEKNRILTQIFGVEALAAANNLITAFQSGNRVIDNQAEKLRQATDAAGLYKQITSDLRGAIDELISAVQDKLLTAFQAAEPFVKEIVTQLKDAVNSLTTGQIIDAVENIGVILIKGAFGFYDLIRVAINAVYEFLNSPAFQQVIQIAKDSLASLGFTSLDDQIAVAEQEVLKQAVLIRELELSKESPFSIDFLTDQTIGAVQEQLDAAKAVLANLKAQKAEQESSLFLIKDRTDLEERLIGKIREGAQLIRERAQAQAQLGEVQESQTNQIASSATATVPVLNDISEKLENVKQAGEAAFGILTQQIKDIYSVAFDDDLPILDRVNQIDAFVKSIESSLPQLAGVLEPGQFQAVQTILVDLLNVSDALDKIGQSEAAEAFEKMGREIKKLDPRQQAEFARNLQAQFDQYEQIEEQVSQINERGIERTEVEQINYDYANEIAKVKADQNLTIEQEIQLVNALEDAQQRELDNQEKKLTYLDKVNESLQEQLGLSEGAAAAVISGVSGAGPNASRAANIAQSKSPEEAAVKLILSNEKVAAAIEEQFTILFDTIDPLIDILGDLISAINRLIGALLEGAGNAIENLADSLGIGPNSYYGGGGFTRDIEALGGAAGGGSRPTNAEQAVLAAISSLDSLTSERSAVVQNLIETAEASGDIQATIIAFRDSVDALINQIGVNYAATYGDSPDFMESFANAAQMLKSMIQRASYSSYQDFVENYNPIMTGPEGSESLREDSAILLAVANAEIAIEELVGGIAGSSTDISEGFEAVSDKIFETAEEQIRSIQFQQLSAEEQIETLHEQAMAALESQKALLSLIESEERRAELLGQIEAAEGKQLELYNLQISELRKLNEEREREAALLLQQQGQGQVDKLLSDLEKTFDNIIELVESLRDQATGLLFGSSSTLTNQQKFELAASEYQELLAAALDPDATEENVKDFQDFVDTYLKSAQDVFKSSSRYQNIFNSVLADIEEVANFVSIAMPISEIESVKKQLVEVAEEFGIGIKEVIEGLDNLSRSLVYQAVVSNVPVSAFIDSEQSDLVIEAVVTAIADPELSDTQIEAVVTAIMAAGSDTVIDAIVKAVQAPGSDTTIEAIIQAILDAKNSDTIVETPVTAIIDEANSSLVVDAVVTAVSGQQLEIDALVTAVMATGSDTVIEAVVTAVEDQNLSDTEIEAIVTAAMATGSNTTILAVVNAILDAAKSDLTLEAIVTAIAASGSDTQIEALVTAIAASGSDTQIEAIVKAIMASGSDTQIEAIVSAVASNTPVISAIVSAVAANTPVVTPTVTLDDSKISLAFSSLSQTLEDSINRLIESIRLQELKSQAAASGIFTTGGFASTYATNMAGGGSTNLISGSPTTDLRPSGETTDYGGGLAPGFQLTGYLSTDQIFQALLNRARVLNPEVLSKPYYVLRATNASNADRTPYLDAFDDLNSAQTFYDNALGNGYYYYKWNYGPVQKYGFREGGLVPDPLDTIPAMLSPGEYILSPETVRRYGVSNLNRLNSGDTAALNATSDPEVKRLLAELIVAVRENDTEVNVYTDIQGQTKASIEEFRSELRERTRRQGEQYVPARYI